jgi:hypothetical protein
MAEQPSRNDGVTIACPVCTRAFVPAGRQRFCSPACRQAAWRRRHPTPLPPLPTRLPQPATVYECPTCGTRFLGQQRCPECQQFCRRVGPGGLCPHCEEPVAFVDLLPSDAGPFHRPGLAPQRHSE